MTKFLLDENVPPAIGVFLRSMNFDVVHAKESGMLGAPDDQIMDLARGVKDHKQRFTTEAQRAQRKQGLTEESGRSARVSELP